MLCLRSPSPFLASSSFCFNLYDWEYLTYISGSDCCFKKTHPDTGGTFLLVCMLWVYWCVSICSYMTFQLLTVPLNAEQVVPSLIRLQFLLLWTTSHLHFFLTSVWKCQKTCLFWSLSEHEYYLKSVRRHSSAPKNFPSPFTCVGFVWSYHVFKGLTVKMCYYMHTSFTKQERGDQRTVLPRKEWTTRWRHTSKNGQERAHVTLI